MQLYLIVDNTAGCIYKLVNKKGLIDYANKAHFIDETSKAETVEQAINILASDMFHVESIEINEDKSIIVNLNEILEVK